MELEQAALPGDTSIGALLLTFGCSETSLTGSKPLRCNLLDFASLALDAPARCAIVPIRREHVLCLATC